MFNPPRSPRDCNSVLNFTAVAQKLSNFFYFHWEVFTWKFQVPPNHVVVRSAYRSQCSSQRIPLRGILPNQQVTCHTSATTLSKFKTQNANPHQSSNHLLNSLLLPLIKHLSTKISSDLLICSSPFQRFQVADGRGSI